MIECMRSKGVPVSVVRRAVTWFQRERFDSDAIQQDVDEQTVKNKESSMACHIDDELLLKSVSEFVENTTGSFPINIRLITSCPLFIDDVCCTHCFQFQHSVSD